MRIYRFKKHDVLKKVLIAVGGVLAVCVAGFFIYLSVYYKADEVAMSLYEGGEGISVVDDMIILTPEVASGVGIVFYPGAKVETIAYLPILDKLADEGITCVLIDMPFHMAFFNVNAADDVFERVDGVDSWYIAGHSLGGGMASSYASEHEDAIDGLILLGAYVYGTYPPSKALTVYGTFNSNLEESIDYTENIVIIEGGNHAQFGNYGKQKGDPDATISWEEQQEIAVDAIMDFIGSMPF
ncbi:MAG: alpha/beta fold hydrolase [Lachnospiraceae bacterium]